MDLVLEVLRMDYHFFVLNVLNDITFVFIGGFLHRNGLQHIFFLDPENDVIDSVGLDGFGF